MWIVRLALRRPYTVACMAILMVLMGAFAAFSMPTDIFPSTNIPIVSVVWSYNGLPAKDMEGRIITISERAYTTGVADIEHIESTSLDQIAVIRVYIQPTGDVSQAVAEVTATSQAILRQCPPGTTPPYIIRYDATDVPIMEVGLSSETAGEQELNDVGNSFVRPQLVTAQGANLPPVFGGPPKQVQVDIDPVKLQAKGLSATDISSAINAQSLVLPAGTAKMGTREYQVALNAQLPIADQMNNAPIKMVNGQMVYIRDVANVRLGAGVQTNIVRINGRRSAYIEVLKFGAASTITVVNKIRGLLPLTQQAIPPEITLKVIEDQSTYVRLAITGVVEEMVIAGCLTGLMILLFLGSWRSTVIVACSIPLSILTSVVVLWALGETINLQSLGGLALAVGILVDDATVEIENVHRNMAQGKNLLQAIIDAASQVAVPAIVASLSICIVFVPIFFLAGASAALFKPLALAVIFAVLASYLLSRTLVPTMVHHMLGGEIALYQGTEEESLEKRRQAGFLWRINAWVEERLEHFRQRYVSVLDLALAHSRITLGLAGVFVAGSMVLIPMIGEDFFPSVDAGQFQLHVRAPGGTRLEESELIFGAVERTIKRIVPPKEIELMRTNIGLAGGGVALATGDLSVVGPADGLILVSLGDTRSKPTAYYQQALRDTLAVEFPEEQFWYEPADIVTEVLNQGLAAPIDVQIVGQARDSNYLIAEQLATQIRHLPGAGDVRVGQVNAEPELLFNVDRDRAQQVGLTESNVAQAMLVSLSGSFQTSPNFFLDPTNGVNYTIFVQTPQYRITSIPDLAQTPITTSASANIVPQLFANLATTTRVSVPASVNHYNIRPAFDVYAGPIGGRDLGGLAQDIQTIVNHTKLPRGSIITIRGQVQNMRQSFNGLIGGILAALLLVFILLVVNFQTWLDPIVIIGALPGALAGVLWALFVTRTPFSVPALMGTIMSLGVATSNSVLLITFADDGRRGGYSAHDAAIEAGSTRLRPVMMTALAMIIGMIPMALALSDGGAENAPLGRAVIGGLIIASLFTLIIVPTLYATIRKNEPLHEITLPEATPIEDQFKAPDTGGAQHA
ncbi:MAG TPA: efflux RND transporter permease subunit [Gemmatimonadaceae bacterium]|nr:efflux RND transporter permease subunit [Gemmatimonadaceae bacterium]